MNDYYAQDVTDDWIAERIAASEELCAEIAKIRRDLHEHPELSHRETRTTAYLRRYLSQIGGAELADLPIETGCVAILNGSKPGKTVALRADIDALAGDEAHASDCMSREPHVAHLCGHDMHMASLCGAARLLSGHCGELPGRVAFIFQPAEETTDGAEYLMSKGLFEKVPFDAIFGLHNRPEIPTGRIAVKQGGLMAAKINFKISVHGVGGHGSMPHLCVDPIACAAAIVLNALTITSRNTDPMESAVLSICSIHGGTPDNLIVDTAEMTGSMRYLDKKTGQRALSRLRTIVSSTAQAFECRADFEIAEQVDAVDNSAQLYAIARKAAADAVGADNVEDSRGCLASEDFSVYMRRAPGFFYWVGNRKPGDEIASWHNARFRVDDASAVCGARLLAASAWRYLMQS